jgi:hypothetical protein
MQRMKWRLLGILILTPFSAFAHGEEVFYTFFIQLSSLLIFLVVLISLKISIRQKLIVTAAYLLAVFLTWYSINELPYRGNMSLINTLVSVVPVGVVLLTFLVLRLLPRKQT